MSKHKSTGLYLVTTAAVKKKFDMFYVFLADGSIFEYKLSEYRIMRDQDWVEVESIDNTIMESFFNSNIMRVKFLSSKAKLVVNEKKAPDLKPIA